MRTVLVAFAAAAITVALPAQAQRQDRNSTPFPRLLQEDRQPAFDFTRIGATDSQDRALMVMVSAPRPGNKQPYRAYVAWAGAPDHYWSIAFAFDCASRSMSNVDSVKRRWHRGYKADDSFPLGDAYRGDLSSLMAPAICDGQTGVVSRNARKALDVAHGYVKPAG